MRLSIEPPDDVLEEDIEEIEPEEAESPCGGRIGRYEIFYRLGRGGMATVYLGRLLGAAGFERWVAVKQIHEHLSDKAKFREMFLDEARVAAQLSHPNLVQVTDVGLEGGRPYLVMEFVNGETLGHLILKAYRTGRLVPLDIAVRIVANVCEGLHHAHELRDDQGQPRELVHRDVSPHNVLISYDGVVKVTDFGIVKAAGRSTHTRAGVIKGKPQYMAPEQILARPIDRRADIFALGIVLYETTLMRRLFKDVSDYAGLRRIVSGDVPKPRTIQPDYPDTLEAIVLKALHVKPEARYQTARELQADLERYLIDTGRAVGTAEVSETMRELFGDRIQGRVELLAWATSARSEELQKDRVQLDVTPSDVADSLPGHDTAEQEAQAVARGAGLSSASRWTSMAVLMLALVTAVGAGFWVARSATTESGETVAALVAPRDEAGVDRAPRTDDGQGGEAQPIPLPASTDAAPGPRSPSADATPPELVWNDQPDAGASVSSQPDEHGDAGGESPIGIRTGKAPPRRLTPAPGPPGTLSVMADPWCEVYIGGRRLGRTPLMRVSVPSGRHVVLFLPRGERPGIRRTIRVRPGEHTPVSVDLRR